MPANCASKHCGRNLTGGINCPAAGFGFVAGEDSYFPVHGYPIVLPEKLNGKEVVASGNEKHFPAHASVEKHPAGQTFR
jgi:hypothetical protein